MNAPQAPAPERAGAVSVLLVDDQKARLMSYESILEPLGLNLVCAQSGPEALEQLMRSEFALILLDVSMPGMDGFETAAMIHDHPRFERTPIVFVTGVHDTEFDRLKGYKLGAVDYVSVPVVPEILRSKVAVLVELHCKRRDLQVLNKSLAEANATLQMEKARELEALNADLRISNSDLEQANRALHAQIAVRNRVERALKEADRRKDEFLAILAHELRNPLAALSAAARLLNRTALDADMTAVACDSVQRQVGHMARLLDDLLDVSRISHGRMHLRLESVNVAEVVRSAVDMVRPQLEAKRQQLQVEIPQDTVPAMADKVRLIQVIANLLNNSVKYTPTGGLIQVELRCAQGVASVCVRDNGIGIAPEMLERVFDMFSQGGRNSSEAQSGLGIGLTLVKGLVALHNGTVRALSEGDGRGSEFTIELPSIANAVEQVSSGMHVTRAAARPLRILVADDNVDSATSWSMLMQEEGHEVCTTHDGLAALAAVEQFRPQVALLDIGMPGLDGYELARRIRDIPWGADILLIAITGWGQERDRIRAGEAGFDVHFTKPLDPDRLFEMLQQRERRLNHLEKEQGDYQ